MFVSLPAYECSCCEFGMTDPSSPTDEQVVFVLAPKKEYAKNRPFKTILQYRKNSSSYFKSIHTKKI